MARDRQAKTTTLRAEDDDVWTWTVIFVTCALAGVALSLAVLLSVG
jgi:hypothetical protein